MVNGAPVHENHNCQRPKSSSKGLFKLDFFIFY